MSKAKTKPIPGIPADTRVLIERLGRYVTDRGAILAHVRREGHRWATATMVNTVLATVVPERKFLDGRIIGGGVELNKTANGVNADSKERDDAALANEAMVGRLNEQIKLHAELWGVSLDVATLYLANSTVPA